MKKALALSLVVTLLLVMVGCGSREAEQTDDQINVVASYSVIADMVKQVGQDKVNVTSIVTRGVDPHSYEPTPKDTLAVEKADIVFSNGLNLEAGKGWYDKLIKNARKEKVSYVVSKGVTPMYLTSKDALGQEDPHAWLSLTNGQKYVQNIADELSKFDKENSDFYQKNAQAYQKKLATLQVEGQSEINQIPEKQRVLVTSEGAFKYFAKEFGLKAEYIWEINTDTQGTPAQIDRVVNVVKEQGVPGLFIETSVSPKTMEAVSRQTQVPIVSKVFTDSLAMEGEKGDTYYDMMAWNIQHIAEGLK